MGEMRTVLVMVSAIALGACTVVNEKDDATGGASGAAGVGAGGVGALSGAAGAGGVASGGSGGVGGSGGATDPCNGVPVEGKCVDETTIVACLSPEGGEQPEVITTKCGAGEKCG